MSRNGLAVSASVALVLAQSGHALGAEAGEGETGVRESAGRFASAVLDGQPGVGSEERTETGGETIDTIAEKYLTTWKVQVEPLVWYWAPSGKVRLPATSGTGGASAGGFSDSGSRVKMADLNIDDPRVSPAGEVHFSIDRFRLTFSGAWYEIGRDQTQADQSFRLGSVEVSAGDTMDVDFEFFTSELTLGYNVWSKDFAADTEGSRREHATPLVLRTYLLGGVRMYHTEFKVRNLSTGGEAGASEWFAEPILGGRAEVEINEVFTMDLQLSGGYWADSDKTVSSIDVAVGFMYRPHPNVGIHLGWRQIAFDLNDGEGVNEFEYDGRLAGLYTGVVIRF
ncbi:MAG: hypothetical protein KF768_10685 [Phycisphaeraceae bacterium]|nr:hypothetical protein [Phycisphaeraceae bacterium]